MKISYNWLKDFLPDLTVSPAAIAELLTQHSFETTVVGQLEIPLGITIVKIINIKPHPNADRLRLVSVTDGRKTFTVVCGATNIAVGQVVPYSPPGTILKNENNHNFTVQETSIRGQVSPGMINSLRELGLHPKEHSGIWILPGDVPLGAKLTDHFPADVILDADITPNRAHDCLGHRGLARELAALLGLKIKATPTATLPAPASTVAGFSLAVTDKAKTPRYLGAVLQAASVSISPLWLQARLLGAGGKPMNNLIDITNYVTFELGNPTHAFDIKNLPGKVIGTRQAKVGEKITLLDDTEHNLTEQDLVITCADTPVAIAGVMGGRPSGITSDTRDIFLEVANFNAYSVQETARRLGLFTEASSRFSKGLDINLVADTTQRTVGLLQELTGAVLVGILDTHPQPRLPQVINFHPSRAAQVAGSNIFTARKSKQALTRLRFIVDDTKEPWQVTVPTDRLDIDGEHDLVEEIIRTAQLNEIVPTPAATAKPQALPHWVYWQEVVRDTLVQLGLTETLNYSFEPQHYAAVAGLAEEEHLSLVNPVAPDMKNLRLSLLPGLLKNLVTNRDAFQRHAGRKESSLFEMGHVYQPGAGDRVPGVIEEVHLAAVLVGRVPRLADIAESLAQALNLDSLDLSSIVTPDMAQALKYHLPVFGFEINLDELLLRLERSAPPAARSLADLKPTKHQPALYVPLPRYPASYRDLSILVDSRVTIEQAQEIIERAGGQLVTDVDLFDEYQPPRGHKKSLAFHLTYQSLDKTLTDTEVAKIHNQIVLALTTELSAQLRE